MVTGGLISGVDILDSTEILSSIQQSSEDTKSNLWKTLSGKLPIPLVGLRVATINNRVLSFGIENFLSLSSMCLFYRLSVQHKVYKTTKSSFY